MLSYFEGLSNKLSIVGGGGGADLLIKLHLTKCHSMRIVQKHVLILYSNSQISKRQTSEYYISTDNQDWCNHMAMRIIFPRKKPALEYALEYACALWCFCGSSLLSGRR